MNNKIFRTHTDDQMRVFISSTFKDLNEERDYLMKNIFPEIRKFAVQHGVFFLEVDLRWGITEEESAKMRIIETCLREIDRCRPYFIGIIGHKYGSVFKDQISKEQYEIAGEYLWVKNDINRGFSITEIEIQHGILRNPEMRNKGRFYFQENELNGLEEEKVCFLKEEIKKSGSSYSYFSGKVQLGESILKDLKEIIDEKYPVVNKEEWEIIRDEHAAFARTLLAENAVYIHNNMYYTILDNYIWSSEEAPFVISGESGSGKSSLIINWLYKYNKENPEVNIIYHFAGNVQDSTDPSSILKRIITEIKHLYKVKGEVPEEYEALKKTFSEFFSEIKTGSPFLLVIDALNRVAMTKEGILDWLPQKLPPHVKILVTVTPGDSLNHLKQRGCRELTVLPLDDGSSRKLIADYLTIFGKRLPQHLTDEIIAVDFFRSPMLLKTLLNELRVVGNYERLQEQVRYYLDIKSLKEFYGKVFGRFEVDYDMRDRPIVRDILSYIILSKNGLSETEIIDITQIEPVYWHMFYYVLEPYLVYSNGLLNLSHDHIKNAAKERYLETVYVTNIYRKQLINYFENDKYSSRAIEELPYLYVSLEMWGELCMYITDPYVIPNIREYTFIRLFNHLILIKELDIKSTICLHEEKFNVGTDYSFEKLAQYLKTISQYLAKVEYIDCAINVILSFIQDCVKLDCGEMFGSKNKITFDIQGGTPPQYLKQCDHLCEIYDKLADLYAQGGNNENAIKYYNLIFELLGKYYPDINDYFNTIDIQFKLAIIQKGSDGKDILNSIYLYFQKSVSCGFLITALEWQRLGSAYEQLGNFKKAKECFHYALEKYKKGTVNLQYIQFCILYVEYCSVNNKIKEASDNLDKAIDLVRQYIKNEDFSYKDFSDIVIVIGNYVQSDNICLLDDDIKKLTEILIEMREILLRRYGEKNEILISLDNSLSWLFLNSGSYEQLYFYVAESESLIQQLFGENSVEMFRPGLTKAWGFYREDKKEEGKNIVRQLENLMPENNPSIVADMNISTGNLFFEHKDYQMSLFYYKRAENLEEYLSLSKLSYLYKALYVASKRSAKGLAAVKYKIKEIRLPKNNELVLYQWIIGISLFMIGYLFFLRMNLFLGAGAAVWLFTFLISSLFPKYTWAKKAFNQINWIAWMFVKICLAILIIIMIFTGIWYLIPQT